MPNKQAQRPEWDVIKDKRMMRAVIRIHELSSSTDGLANELVRTLPHLKLDTPHGAKLLIAMWDTSQMASGPGNVKAPVNYYDVFERGGTMAALNEVKDTVRDLVENIFVVIINNGVDDGQLHYDSKLAFTPIGQKVAEKLYMTAYPNSKLRKTEEPDKKKSDDK